MNYQPYPIILGQKKIFYIFDAKILHLLLTLPHNPIQIEKFIF